MIKIIIGQNASGKTLYLNNCIDSELMEFNTIDFVTNMKDASYNDVSYNQERLEILESITDVERIDTSNELLALIGNPIKLSKDFLQIVTLLCKECKRVYLDEPEQGLSEYEINLLVSFLQYADNTYEEIIVVTHSELFVQIPVCKIFTPKMSETTSDIVLFEVEEDQKFEVID